MPNAKELQGLFNRQAALPVEKVFSSTLLLKEVFYTLQGEGPFSGEPAVFVRLAGCPLRCSRCDTDYSSDWTLTVEELLEVVHDTLNKEPNKKVSLCVVTGGEPFRQNRLPGLLEQLLRVFQTVQLETSGSCWQPGYAPLKAFYPNRLIMVCSPKTPKLHPQIIPHIDAYKYVVRAAAMAEDGLPSEEPQFHMAKPVARPHDPSIPVYIAPWDEHDCGNSFTQANIQAAVHSSLKHGYRLSLQVHKLVNLP